MALVRADHPRLAIIPQFKNLRTQFHAHPTTDTGILIHYWLSHDFLLFFVILFQNEMQQIITML
jgi:hypothetical protein